jgi:putative ABC transport system permease protein
MWRWAIRSFLDEKASLAASSAGVAVVFLLVLILEGAFQGEADQIVALVERSDAPVWVMQSGVSNMHMASSSLDEEVAMKIRAVPGVSAVEGILYRAAVARLGNEERAVYLIGVRPGQRTGPWKMSAGTAHPARGVVVLPDMLARKAGIVPGSVIEINRRPFRVGGLSEGTYSMASSLVFMHASDVAALFDIVADAHYLLVWPGPGVGGADLARRVRQTVPSVSVLERLTLVHNDRTLALQMGGDLIRIMTVVAGLVATLIVAFTVFTFSARRSRELAVAKAVGARAPQLLAAAMGQAAALAVLGYGLALGLAAILQPVFGVFSPGVVIHFSTSSMARIGVAALAVALIAGAVPAWRVLRVDPTLVFSS